MVFAWEPNTPNEQQVIDTLPAEAQRELRAFLDAVVFKPMEYARQPDEPADKAVRVLPFASGRGLVTFQVYVPDRLVLVLRVQWMD